MSITVNLVFFFKLRIPWATLYSSLLVWIENSFIKSSKKFARDIYNYLEAHSEPYHLSKIELFAIVNRWKALNIFAKKIRLGCLIGLWMTLRVLTIYLMAKNYILRLGELIDEEDK